MISLEIEFLTIIFNSFMNKTNLYRGFTLIELLVVIAIIGILAAVVLGSLNDARDNANDASAKTSMNNIRNAAEIFYSENNFTYGTADTTWVDAGTQTVGAGTGICLAATPVNTLFTAANTQVQTSTTGQGGCYANDEAYAAEIELRSGRWFCVDSSGRAGEQAASSLGAADTTCGA